jgi:hypothetical protein
MVRSSQRVTRSGGKAAYLTASRQIKPLYRFTASRVRFIFI